MKNNWIEIAGLPGVGKTTLIEKYRSVIGQTRKIVESRRPTLLNRILAKIYYFFLTGRILKLRDAALNMAYRLSFRFFEKRDQSVLFFDSGIVQPVLEYVVSYGDADIEDFLTVLNKVSLPSTLVYLSDSIDSILKHETTRDARRYPNLGGKSLAERYRYAEEVLKNKVFPLIQCVYIVNIKNEKEFLEKIAS